MTDTQIEHLTQGSDGGGGNAAEVTMPSSLPYSFEHTEANWRWIFDEKWLFLHN